MNEDDWPPLTDEDRRRIARIRRQLDQEFGGEDDVTPQVERRHRPLTLAVVVAAAVGLSIVGDTGTRPSMTVTRTAPPGPAVALEGVSPTAAPPVRPAPVEETPQQAVRGALEAWIEATRRGDLSAQMAFYPAVVPVFYTWRNAASTSVLAEKQKILGNAWTLDIHTGPPAIELTADGGAAVTRFRKAYVIEGPRVRRRGEVLQELRWIRTEEGWKITSERDAAVLARTALSGGGAPRVTRRGAHAPPRGRDRCGNERLVCGFASTRDISAAGHSDFGRSP